MCMTSLGSNTEDFDSFDGWWSKDRSGKGRRLSHSLTNLYLFALWDEKTAAIFSDSSKANGVIPACYTVRSSSAGMRQTNDNRSTCWYCTVIASWRLLWDKFSTPAGTGRQTLCYCLYKCGSVVKNFCFTELFSHSTKGAGWYYR